MLALLFAASYSLAHSGGTDSSGGHIDHSTGEYHYHHGRPPHQHPDGVCPYIKSNDEKLGTDFWIPFVLLWLSPFFVVLVLFPIGFPKKKNTKHEHKDTK
jgi:hypothetical protein